MATILDFQSEQLYFWSTSRPNTSYKVSSQVAFQIRISSKLIFKMAALAALLASIHLGFGTKTILVVFFIYKLPQYFLPSFK